MLLNLTKLIGRDPTSPPKCQWVPIGDYSYHNTHIKSRSNRVQASVPETSISILRPIQGVICISDGNSPKPITYNFTIERGANSSSSYNSAITASRRNHSRQAKAIQIGEQDEEKGSVQNCTRGLEHTYYYCPHLHRVNFICSSHEMTFGLFWFNH